MRLNVKHFTTKPPKTNHAATAWRTKSCLCVTLTWVMIQKHDAFTSVNSQMWDETTFWTNRCIKDTYTTGDAVMRLVHWLVISPPREQKRSFSHMQQSYRLRAVIAWRSSEDVSAQILFFLAGIILLTGTTSWLSDRIATVGNLHNTIESTTHFK